MSSQMQGGVTVSPYYFPFLKLSIDSVILGSCLFGCYSLLFIFAVYVLVRTGLKQTRQRVMTAAIVWMYLVIAARWLDSVLSFMNFVKDPINGSYLTPKSALVEMVLLCSATITSDIIVLWRAHAIWGRNLFVYFISTILFLAMIASFIQTLVEDTKALSTDTIEESRGVTVAGVLGLLASFGINFWATCVVATKTWIHRTQVASVLRANRDKATERMLGLLVDSGIFYSLAWAVALGSVANGLNNPAMEDPTSVALTYEFMVFAIMPHLVGMYPTLIIVALALGRTTDSSREMFTTQISTTGTWPQFSGTELSTDASHTAHTDSKRTETAQPLSFVPPKSWEDTSAKSTERFGNMA